MTYAGLVEKRAAESKEKRDDAFIAGQKKIGERMKEATDAKKAAQDPDKPAPRLDGKDDPEYQTKVMRVLQPGDVNPANDDDKMAKVDAHKKKVKEAADAAIAKKKAEETKKAEEAKLAEKERRDQEKALKEKLDK